jgi:hypothetical protein
MRKQSLLHTEQPWAGGSPRDWFHRHAHEFLYAPEYIAACAQPYEFTPALLDECGIYFLLIDDEIYYVGMSKSIGDRVEQHRCAGIPFNRWFFIHSIPSLFVRNVELFYLHTFAPRGNHVRQHPGSLGSLVEEYEKGGLRLIGAR